MICTIKDYSLWEEYWGQTSYYKEHPQELEHEWNRQLWVLGYQFVPNLWYIKRRIKSLFK